MTFELNILGNNEGDCCSGESSGGQCGTSGGCGCSDQMDEDSRRNFLKKATTTTIGAFSLSVLPMTPDAGEQAQKEIDGHSTGGAKPASPGDEVLYGFLVDTSKCIGAGKCLTACREENNVPEGYARTWVERFVHFKDGTVQVDLVPETGFTEEDASLIDPEQVARAYFVPKLCNHCEDAPCNQVCPVHASYTSPEGIELVDGDRCIGCAYCVQACPYGVRFMNPDTGNADKCTWCYHRITRDEKPACVEACPVNARVFGRLDDPNSEISKRLASVPTSVLKENLGTHPKLYYMGNSGEVI